MPKLWTYNKYYFIGVLVFILSACSPNKPTNEQQLLQQLDNDIQQAIIVTSQSWADQNAFLQRFEKQQEKWYKVATPIPVKVGRNGMAWGRGIYNSSHLSQFKQEGDGKAPAGIFTLGTSFGYAAQALAGQHYPYRIATERDYYIDDIDSKDYNRWVHIDMQTANTPHTYWKSYERMHRDDALYELGLEIQHNKQPIMTKAGSAIFFHIWQDKDTSTAGCTAMSKQNLAALLRWLDPNKFPVLIQAPLDALPQIKMLAPIL